MNNLKHPDSCQTAEEPLSCDVKSGVFVSSYISRDGIDDPYPVEMVVAIESNATSEIDVKSIKNENADDGSDVRLSSDVTMSEQSNDVTNIVTSAAATIASEQSHVKVVQDGRPSSTNDLHILSRLLSSDSSEVETLSSHRNDELGSGTVGVDNDETHALDGESKEKAFGPCKVCGDNANGKYFGALVCVPCKTFFLRYANDGYSFVCKGSQDCSISVSTRIHCKHCRYKKCIEAGMNRKVRPIQVEPREGRQLCVVCSDLGNGVHFGAMTCEGCKKFFRRGLSEHESYMCKYNKQCSINPQTRNSCRYCRYEKCIKSGMSREAIQMGRPSKLTGCFGNKRSEKEPQQEPVESNTLEVDSSDSNVDGVMDLSMTISRASASAVMNPHVVNNFQALYHSQLDMVCKEIQRIQSSNLMFGNQSSSNRVANFLASNSIFPNPILLTSNIQNMPQSDSTVSSSAEINNDQQASLICDVRKVSKRRRKTPATAVRKSEESECEVHSSQTNAVKKWHFHEPLPAPMRHKAKINGSRFMGSYAKRSNEEAKLDVNNSLIPPPVLNAVNNFGCDVMNVVEGLVPWQHKRLENLSVDRVACSSPSVTSSEEATTVDVVEKEMGVKSEFEDLLSADLKPDYKIMTLYKMSQRYWTEPPLPDENVLFTNVRHYETIQRITSNYERFVQIGNKINIYLKKDYDDWRNDMEKDNGCVTVVQLSEWIKQKVIPAYTVASVTYCKNIPEFRSFDQSDQITIIRLGQSPSRILVAAMHWYDSENRDFNNFLAWRNKIPGKTDRFKQSLIQFAEKLKSYDLDLTETSLLNALLIVATDYPDLENKTIIEETRRNIISTFRAYTTAKFGTPNDRLEKLFKFIPELRKLGLVHHEMTNTKTMMAEEFGENVLTKLNL